MFPKEIAKPSQQSEPKTEEKSERITVASLIDESNTEKHAFPIYEPLEPQFTRHAAPDLYGARKLPVRDTFHEGSHKEWNIDGLSATQIRQVLDQMIVEYKLMCVEGKNEVEACKTIIACFTGTLARWWELESSPVMLTKMEQEVLKDEQGDIRFNDDGTPQNNMIGALTALIQEHFCGADFALTDKNELILMKLKCRNINQYEDFHRDWIERIFLDKDPKNILWKQFYLAALPSKLVDILKLQEAFPLPLEVYLWGDFYSIITKVLITLCTSSKMTKSIDKLNRLPGTKSFCNRYGITIDDPLVTRRKTKRHAKKAQRRSRASTYRLSSRKRRELRSSHRNLKERRQHKGRKGYYRSIPKTHYYQPHDIRPKDAKIARMNEVFCWLCGQPGHTSNICPTALE